MLANSQTGVPHAPAGRSRPLPVCHGGVCTVKVREEENSVIVKMFLLCFRSYQTLRPKVELMTEATPTQTLWISGEEVLFWS